MSYTQTVTTYHFSELPSEVQKRLIHKYDVNDNWDEWIIADIYLEAKELGIEDFDFQYTGFGSQGDGCSFTGTLTRELAESIYKKNINRDGWDENSGYDVTFKRKSYPHYVHEKMVYAQISAHNQDEFDNEHEDTFENVYNDWKDDLCDEWYQRLGTTYFEMISDESIKEEYESWGPVFLIDGRVL